MRDERMEDLISRVLSGEASVRVNHKRVARVTRIDPMAVLTEE